MEEEKKEEIVRSFDQEKKFSLSPKIIISLLLIAVVGAFSGFILAQRQLAAPTITTDLTNSTEFSKGQTFGSNDTKTFKDTAEGTLKDGGINGEGQYHLEREGGESQNVYVTSSTVDLSILVDKKIKVWGQTQKAQYAGWLMDVGRVEVL
ncbi:MAG: hypothetical protein HYT09_02505 [Candidatus Levybacteria bacterium]|nr:hypothetical protein [Candidatus Levybacteria bacterium]